MPLLFIRSAGRFALGASNAVASGVMLAASVSLSLQGADRSLWRAGVGIALGVCFVLLTERYLEHDHGHAMGSLRGEDARRALLIVGVMTVHSAAEGIGVGAAFADGSTLGLLIAVAIAVHNIPEGLAISLVLVPRGSSVGAAAGCGALALSAARRSAAAARSSALRLLLSASAADERSVATTASRSSMYSSTSIRS